MSTEIAYNPNRELNERLLAAGASKTVYALVTTASERVKRAMFADPQYMDEFRGAWMGRQDKSHLRFFDRWHEWSSPVVDLDRKLWPKFYPTNGASEGIRHLIYQLASAPFLTQRLRKRPTIHCFVGEYEGYHAMADAAGLGYVEHPRNIDYEALAKSLDPFDQFFISQPSAIDGMVWWDFNRFLDAMPDMSVVADLTYVGAVPASAVNERFNMNAPSVRNVIFSLSKPFGVYYDRVGGVWSRTEDDGLFGNKWFKNLTSLRLGTDLMVEYGVFHMANAFAYAQQQACKQASNGLRFDIQPADVFILGTGTSDDVELAEYLRRPRLCLTPAMAAITGTAPQFLEEE